MSVTANALGLTNAATPIGLKVMKELQEENPNKEKATDAMCMFLGMNTAGFSDYTCNCYSCACRSRGFKSNRYNPPYTYCYNIVFSDSNNSCNHTQKNMEGRLNYA